MPNYLVTSEFPTGTTGTVEFERKAWLNDHGMVVPPRTEVATISGTPPEISQSLRATVEDGVSPSFQYHVRILIDGQDEIIGRMDLTANAELADIFQWTTPPLPDTFVTRAEYEEDQEAIGNPASQAALDALELRVDETEDDIAALEASDTSQGTAITSLVGITTDHEGRIDDLGALGVPDPASGTDDDVLQVQGGAYVLAPAVGGGGGGGGAMPHVAAASNVANVPVLASGTPAAVKDDELFLTLTMPATGFVFVHLQAYARLEGGSAIEWALYDELDAVAVDFQIVTTGDANPGMRCQQTFIFFGTPDVEYTLVWWHQSTGGAAYTWYGPYGTGKVGPALMWWEEVVSA